MKELVIKIVNEASEMYTTNGSLSEEFVRNSMNTVLEKVKDTPIDVDSLAVEYDALSKVINRTTATDINCSDHAWVLVLTKWFSYTYGVTFPKDLTVELFKSYADVILHENRNSNSTVTAATE